VVDGPTVSFLGFPYPTRMVIVRLTDGSAWVWSPVALTPDVEGAVNAIGPLRYIVSPNKIHHLWLKEWAERWPDAQLYAPPGLAKKRSDLIFAGELRDEPNSAWATDIDQTVFRGSIAMVEVVFFHRTSRTAIFGDLVQRHDPAQMRGLKGIVMRLDGLVGERGSTPREWRATFVRRRIARAALARVLAWKPERLVVAHGACAQRNAIEILGHALSWI
jgi:hypothetical protein